MIQRGKGNKITPMVMNTGRLGKLFSHGRGMALFVYVTCRELYSTTDRRNLA